MRTSTKRLHGSAKISLAAEISARNERNSFWARSMNRPSWRWAHLSAANMEYENVVKMTTSIQGHKRHLSEEDKARLQASVDARYQDKAAATGSIMLCELQGATEEFIFRWNVIFQEHPDVLTDKTCRKTIFELLDRMTNYLKTIKEEKL